MKPTLPILALVVILLTASCSLVNPLATQVAPANTPDISYLPGIKSSGSQAGAKAYPPPTAKPTVAPSATATKTRTPGPTPTPSASPYPTSAPINRLPPYSPHTGEKLSYEQWQDWPELPVVSQRAKEIYARGISKDVNPNDPRKFSKVGDCQSIRQYFLGVLDDAVVEQRLSTDTYKIYKATLDNFHGSFDRLSMSVRTGFNVASVLSPLNSDPKYCDAKETPLECEFRIWTPSIVLISMETWYPDNRPDNRPTDTYEGYLRQIVDFALSREVLPILATKADNLEGNYSINKMIARVAYEYDLPLWNFWKSVQKLPGKGLMDDGFHLTNGPSKLHDEGLEIAWNVRNLTALKAIDKVWKEVKK